MGPLTIDFLVEVSGFISETVVILSHQYHVAREVFLKFLKQSQKKKSDMLAQCFLHSHIGSFSSLKNQA